MKKRTGKILGSVALVAAVMLSAGAIIKVSKNETTKKVAGTALSWEVGTLNATTGKKATSTEQIRTKDYISIDDFRVDVDDEVESSYYVYLYDRDKEFLGKTAELDEDFDFEADYDEDDKDDVAYAKVLISVDDDDISALELPGYIAPYEISIAK